MSSSGFHGEKTISLGPQKEEAGTVGRGNGLGVESGLSFSFLTAKSDDGASQEIDKFMQ